MALKRVKHDGKIVDERTDAWLTEAEKKLGYPLTVIQGCYNGGKNKVDSSAGTHDGGGVVDLAPYDYAKKCRILRGLGIAAYFRPRLIQNGKVVWEDHIHCIDIGNPELSPAAKAQAASYRAGGNALAYNAPDVQWRPSKIVPYEWPKKTMLDKRPNLKKAVALLGIVRKNVKSNTELAKRIDDFVGWAKKQ